MQTLDKAYNPKLVEKKWYTLWETGGFFKADSKSDKPPYCIVLPPPNVTGVLHMGHALVNTLQDILIRWKRMSGFETLWVPGTDHAGISTQTVVERHLMIKTGKRRTDFSREEFLSHVWKWKEENESHILYQLKQLGCSCDWSRLRFTMDEEANQAVRTQFKKMYDDKLIYRGNYLVNWDPVTQTALADDEIEYEEKDSYLWYFRYPIEGSKKHLIIATTRPETLLGDTAIAVAPTDERFKEFVGKNVLLPIIGRKIPIITDHYVDSEFGSGVVKITPAHDLNDYEMGIRHHLPMINIMTPDGKINENGLEFAGLSMLDTRKAVVQRMKDLGLIEKIQPHKHRVGISYRSKAVIEPYLSEQWFVRVTDFKERLISTVKEKKVTLLPKHWEKTYYHWIENLRDWCISRQLWWGHRIPIWYHKDDPAKTICYAGNGSPPEVEKNPDEWAQDEDVLDTWFSSSLWPFSSLGSAESIEKFYPNATLITGHDILFFWVARMILMGEYTMKEVPFRESFLHGLIYGKSYWRQKEGHIQYVNSKEKQEFDFGTKVPKDVESKWEKMSKSKGNVIDPIEIIHLYGTDAMRLALCQSATCARQIDLDCRRFEEFKNFVNKIWNGARFVFINLESLTTSELEKGLDLELLTLEDKWIFSLLNRTIKKMNVALTTYSFDQAATLVYGFFWNEFCAYYLEIVKPTLFGKQGSSKLRINKQKILVIVLSNCLRLMHPIAPFITEELYHHLQEHFSGIKNTTSDPYTNETLRALQSPACITAPFPKVINENDINPEIEQQFAFINDIVYAIRNIRAEMQLPPNMATDLHILPTVQDDALTVVKSNQHILSSLIKINQMTTGKAENISIFHSSVIVGSLKLIIPLPQEMQSKEKKRLQKAQNKLITQISGLKSQLGNKSFVERAPEKLVIKTQSSLSQSKSKLKEIVLKLKSY